MTKEFDPGEINLQQELHNSPVRELSEQEFSDLSVRVMEEFGRNVISTLGRTVREGRGKEKLGTVSQRGTETQIALESNIEHMFVNTCDANGLPVYIVGEHYDYKTPRPEGNIPAPEPSHITFIDAVDDTREYEQGENAHQGLPAPLWAAAFTYSLEGKPVAGVIVNIKERTMYISKNDKNYFIDIETGEEKEITPSERTSIKDEKFCLATYLGDPRYFVSFAEDFIEVERALMEADNNAVNQPHTGSFIYGPMADGNVDAYLIGPTAGGIVRGEPISEQLGGWGFAQIAGFKAISVNPEDGSYDEIEHDLNQFKENPDAYRSGRMPYYLAYRSEQVRDEIIDLIVAGYQRRKLQETKDSFIAGRQEEFDIFVASQANPQN